MGHILMTAGTVHQLRIVTCPAFVGWQDRLFDPPNRHRGRGDGREIRGETITGRIRIHHYPAQVSARALQSASLARKPA
jgi:hypothetical protein